MNWREKLADWLTGGEYSRRGSKERKLYITVQNDTNDTIPPNSRISICELNFTAEKDALGEWMSPSFEVPPTFRFHALRVKKHEGEAQIKALRAISAEAKRGKNPNATVRRLGKMAEEALK